MNSPYKSILVIDDDAVNNLLNRQFLTFMLPKSTITAFQSPAQVLHLLKTGKLLHPDLILLDINMPEMTGWEFIDELEVLGRSSDIMILSSSLHEEDVEIARSRSSIKSYIHKPLTEDKIEQHLIQQHFSLLGLDSH